MCLCIYVFPSPTWPLNSTAGLDFLNPGRSTLAELHSWASWSGTFLRERINSSLREILRGKQSHLTSLEAETLISRNWAAYSFKFLHLDPKHWLKQSANSVRVFFFPQSSISNLSFSLCRTNWTWSSFFKAYEWWKQYIHKLQRNYMHSCCADILEATVFSICKFLNTVVNNPDLFYLIKYVCKSH